MDLLVSRRAPGRPPLSLFHTPLALSLISDDDVKSHSTHVKRIRDCTKRNTYIHTPFRKIPQKYQGGYAMLDQIELEFFVTSNVMVPTK